ncbi:hypothetical protein UFOVP813_26 [uncultured Caudovirales phage]|uniref:Uncharacterized protein n=1 Tax=uncultured Caudovirales phage TaxID=2100421 RepID=A0A6J5P0M6_9CAUD|nr:hypothetical protein UFOVP813_26 [uncultured Caudovirales phage]
MDESAGGRGQLVKALINSFNTGEVTPLVVGRVDLENLRRACKTLKNFIARVFGGAFRRPSMMHVAMTAEPGRHSRLIPFAFSTSKKFKIVLGHLTYQIYNADTAAVVFASASAPWTESQIDAIFYTQVNNVMWLAHPDVPTQELIRLSDSSWTLAPVPWSLESAFPPMRDTNVSATKINLAAISGNGVLMLANADTFKAGHVGSYWQVSHFRDILSTELSFAPDPVRSGSTADLTITANTWKIKTEGLWSGTLFVEKYNTTDLAYDVEIQREVTTGNQLSETGFGTGKYRIRVKDITVAPGSSVIFTIGIGAGFSSPQSLTFTAPAFVAGNSTELSVTGQWDLSTYGRWAGEMYLEQKNAAGLWDVLRRWTGAMDRNISASGTVEGTETLRLRASGVYAAPASDVSKPRWVLESTNPLISGLVQVVGYTGPRQVTVNILRPAYSIAETTSWDEGAFSDVRGYPGAVAMHEQRLIFAGTASQPQTIYGSVTGDFRNFRQTGLDDGAFVYQIGAQESNPINWLVSQDGLIVGTDGDEWLLTGGAGALTPSNVTTKRQSGYGSSRVQPVLVGSTVLFVQRGGLSLREYVFQWESQNYVAPNVTQLFSHQILSGIRSVAFSQNPEQILWVVTNDGTLLSCTYRREEQVVAWASHPTDGLVESVSSVYGAPASGDEVWLIVNREGTRRIERLRSGYWSTLERGEQVWHADAAVEKSGSFSSISGLAHIEGKEVVIIADGCEMPSQRVTSGAVTVPDGTEYAVVGLPFESMLQPMPFELPLQDGTAQGRKFRITELSVLLYKSQSGKYGDSLTAPFYDVVVRDAGDDQDLPPPAFTGTKRLTTMSQYKDDASVVIKTSSIMPLNILSLIPTLEVYGS